MKRYIADILATLVAVLGGGAAIFFSYRMREPQSTLDWLSLGFAGIIVGLIGFFLTWGHFQSDPGVEPSSPAFPVVTDQQPEADPAHRA